MCLGFSVFRVIRIIRVQVCWFRVLKVCFLGLVSVGLGFGSLGLLRD